MSAFTKSNLVKNGPFVTYTETGLYHGEGTRFVARFKSGGAGIFMTFLRKHFTVEEYFARLDAGESPLEIAESKGFVSANLRKVLRAGGYPTTQQGVEQMRADRRARLAARR